MKRSSRICALLLIVLTTLPVGPAAGGNIPLTPHAAEYKVKISVLGGRLETQLVETEAGYRGRSLIEATGMSRVIVHGEIVESSDFDISEAGLRPRRFVSDDSLTNEEEQVDLSFDWDRGEITGTINGEPFSAELDGIVHDRVSLQYGLMHDLVNGVHRADYLLQDADELKPLSITNLGSKSVKVPYGSFEAIGIQHQRAGSSRVTTLWCVEELGYLPVIIEQRRKGKLQLRAVLTDYRATS
jgi:hypothetical protein